MGQTESAVHAHRVDPRWARVALDQLRDEEFLSKQLRRQETIAGARHAAATSGASRRQRARGGLFVDDSGGGGAAATRRRGSGDRALWTRLLKQKDNQPLDELDENGGSSVDAIVFGGKLLSLEQRTAMDEAREEELLNSLVLLGNLPQPTRAAYLMCHLMDSLARHCVVSDPVARLVRLRKEILRDIYSAVAVQHQQFKVASNAMASVADAVKKAETRVAAALVNSAAATSMPKSGDKTSVEASFATQFVLEILGSLLAEPMVAGEPMQQRRELLHEMAPLIGALPPLALAPSKRTTLISRSSSSDDSARSLIRKLQGVLLAIVCGEHRDVTETSRDGCPLPEHGSVSTAFDVDDRTIAVTCLIRLAAAVGSVQDFLVVISILLGVEDRDPFTDNEHAAAEVAMAAQRQQVMAAPSSPVAPIKSSRQVQLPLSPVPNSARGIEQVHVKDHESDTIANDERADVSDEVANLAVEQRLKQVHKQRLDVLPKGGGGDLDGQTTAVDQLLAGNGKLKAAPKSLVANHTKAVIANTAIASTTGVHRSSISQVQVPSLVGKNHEKDDFNNSSFRGAAGLGLALDEVFVSKNDAAPSTSPSSPSPSLPHMRSAQCPIFHPLNVASVLKDLDLIKPAAAPTRHGTLVRVPLSSSTDDAAAEPASSSFSHSHHDSGDEDREVWSCGQNSYGELGHGDTNTRKSFERIDALQQKEVVQVSAGNEHTIVLGVDGVVWTCGYNDNGQCGHGVTTRINHLTELQKLDDASPIAQVHAYNGCEHTILVACDGRAASCGYNYRGQLGHGNTQSESVPKIMRSLEGRIVRLVSCSYYHTILTCDAVGGSSASLVYTFGRNDYGQLGHGDSMDRKAPQPVEMIQDHQIVSVACGQYHSMAVTATGKLLAFGKNDYGQLGVETIENQLLPVQVKTNLDNNQGGACLEVRCGYYHSIVLCAGAHVYGFGRNDYGQLGLGKSTNTSAANLQLQQQRFALPQLIDDLEGKEIVRLACGCYHTIAVSDNGVLYVFGRNNHGQLGTGDTNERLYPFPIDDFVGKRVAMVAAGFYHTLVLTGGKDEDEGDNGAGSSNLLHGEEDSTRSDQVPITCSSILSNPVLKDMVDGKTAASIFPSATLKKGLAKSIHDGSNGDWIKNDPSSDSIDGDERRPEERRRTEDGDLLFGDPVAIMVADTAVPCFLHVPSPPSNKTSEFQQSDSVDIAVILLAQLDRLSKPFVPKRAQTVGCGALPLAIVDQLVASARGDLADAVDGCFELYAIHISSTTFTSLCRLIEHLGSRTIEPLSGSQMMRALATATTASARSSGGLLQNYLLAVCLRLLQANLAQLQRSGVFSLLAGLQRDPTSPLGEFHALHGSLESVRHVLLRMIVNHPHHPSSGVDANWTAGSVALDAVDTLMIGFDVFFPCLCSRLALLLRVMSIDNPRDDQTANCASCRAMDWSLLGPKNASTLRPLLLVPLLKRLTDDAAVVRFLPLGSSACRSPRPLGPVVRIISCLVEHLATDFMRTLGEIAADATAGGSQETAVAATNASIALLNAFQKHLASWATTCHRWGSHVHRDPMKKLPVHLAAIASRVFCVGHQVLKEHAEEVVDDFPLAWRGLLEFAHCVVSHSCDLLVQLLARNQPSPKASTGRDRTRDIFADSHFNERLDDALKLSIVGQLVPSLVGSLQSFSRVPAFAASLLPPLMALLKLLDEWNSANQSRQRTSTPSTEEADHRAVGKRVPPAVASRSMTLPVTTRRSVSSQPRSISLRADKAVASTSSPVVKALTLPWAVLLEKELAMLCVELAATITVGDALVEIRDASDESDFVNPAATKWRQSVLFQGGICADFIHKSVVEGSAFDQTVAHTPPLSLAPSMLSMSPFRLVLPPMEHQAGGDGDLLLDSHVPPHDGVLLRCLTQSRVRRFLTAMAGSGEPAGTTTTSAVPVAQSLCGWIRASHAKKDAAYRMLLRQVQLQKQQPHIQVEIQMENAFFAALLHHSSLATFAFQVALTRDLSTSGPPPPRCLGSLWRQVADLRRRFVAKRTAVKNAHELGDVAAHTTLANLQQTMLDRSHLLLLVAVDEEEEHCAYLLDGGFVAPWDPALVYRACTKTEPSSVLTMASRPLRSHLSARYGADEGHTVPFLCCYPSSRWRRIRTLFHVVMRWKFATGTAPVSSLQVAVDALEFVTTDDADVVDVGRFAYHTLIDPCRRLSCSTRGYELLWELVHLPRLESVRVSLLQQIVHSLGSSNLPSVAQAGAAAGVVYRELRRNAQNDFIAAIVQLLVDQASKSKNEDDIENDGDAFDSMMMGSDDRSSCQRKKEATVLLVVLLKVLSLVHFDSEQFQFINDLGVIQVLDYMYHSLDGFHTEDAASTIEAENAGSQDAARNDSIRALTVHKKPPLRAGVGDDNDNVEDEDLAATAQLKTVIWTVMRSLVLHFATVSSASKAAVVPIFPSARDVFESLGMGGDRLVKQQQKPSSSQLSARLALLSNLGGSSNSTIRRSFEILVAPRRFSPMTKGLTFTYAEMTQPSSSSGRLLAMSPLVKPTEFSITTWLYIAAASSRGGPQSSTDPSSELPLEERQVVFLRGDDSEISPYLLLSRDPMESKWQLEVGVAVHAAVASTTRLLWERLMSKDSVPPGKWTHVAIVMEGAKIRLYLNGILDSQRSLSAPLAVAINGRANVDLNFSFGRHQHHQSPSGQECRPGGDAGEGGRTRAGRRGSTAMALLSALLGVSSGGTTAMSPGSLPAIAKAPLQSFDGLLSHFRFHNRSLSPIHVRIVYDEKKPVKEDDEKATSANQPAMSEPAKRLLQLHSLVRVLVESDEGRVHLSDASWTTQLWELFMTSDHAALQVSSLRLLRLLVPLQSPQTLSTAITNHRVEEDEQDGDAFVRHVLLIIGACIATARATDTSLPPLPLTVMKPRTGDPFDDHHTRNLPVELRNSTAKRLVEEDARGGKCIALANELVGFLTGLIQQQDGRSPWPGHVWAVAESVLAEDGARNRDVLKSSSLAYTGCLYVLSGAAAMVTRGAVVEVAGTREKAMVIALDDSDSDAKRNGHSHGGGDSSNRTNSENRTLFVSVDDQDQHSSATTVVSTRPWHDQVFDECASYRRRVAASSTVSFNQKRHDHQEQHQAKTNGSSSTFVRLHQDDVSSSVAMAPLLIDQERSSIVCRHLLDKARGMDIDISPALPENDSMDELRRWQERSFVAHALVGIASTPRGTSLIVQDAPLLAKLLEIGVCDDGNPFFTSLQDVDRKLWIIRMRLYHVLGDLDEQGPVDVSLWLATKQKKHVLQDDHGGDLVSTSREATGENQVDHGNEIARDAIYCPIDRLADEPQEERESNPLQPFQLELSVDEIHSVFDPSSQRNSLDSNVGNPADLVRGVVGAPRGCSADEDGDDANMVDVDGGDRGGDDDGEEDENEDDDEEEGEDDGGEGVEDEENEDEEEEEDEDEDDAKTEEHRQEFVDELMLMGFPEEWCVLALKQTENDIVSASAWIVDNLEYLSRLQTSLDIQRDTQSSDTLGMLQDEDDDVGGQGESGSHESVDTKVGQSMNAVAMANQGQGHGHIHGTSSSASATLSGDGGGLHFINDKEMGRKIFGEMYFPFDDGGLNSSVKDQFLTNWRAETKTTSSSGANGSSATAGTPLENLEDAATANEQQANASAGVVSTDQFTRQVESMEVATLLDHLLDLERASLVASCRRVLVILLLRYPPPAADQNCGSLVELIKSPGFCTLLKAVALRGQPPQFLVTLGDEEDPNTSPDTVVRETLTRTLRDHDQDASIAQFLIDFALRELECAASNPVYEAELWTQRDLSRSDRVALHEPGVELSAWLLDIVLSVSSDTVGASVLSSIEWTSGTLQRLRVMLRSTNLPVKFLAITTMSRVLGCLRQQSSRHGSAVIPMDQLLQTCFLDIGSFLHAAKNRFHREQVQHRTLFSLYLQAYVEILHQLRSCSDTESVVQVEKLPAPIATSCVPLRVPPSPTAAAAVVVASRPRLTFDRKKCRSSLLQISDDGLSVAFTGNEMWKTVVTTQGFSTGVHQWIFRIDKTSSSYLFLGIATKRANLESFLGADDQSWGFIGDKALYYQRNRLRVYGDSFSEGDCVGVRLDCELGTLTFSKNGVSLGVAFENVMDEVFPAVAFYSRHQKVSLVVVAADPPQPQPQLQQQLPSNNGAVVTETEGTVEEAVFVCEMMDNMVAKTPLRPALLHEAFCMTTQWLQGTGKHVVTRCGATLWVDITEKACQHFGFRAEDRVRTPRGNGRVLGVADGRLWVDVDGEKGAWHIDASRLRSLTLGVLPKVEADAVPPNTRQPEPSVHGNSPSTEVTGQQNGKNDLRAADRAELAPQPSESLFSESMFSQFVQDKLWTLSLDRAVLALLNDHCEVANISPWNLSPSEITRIVRTKAHDIEQAAGTTLYHQDNDATATATATSSFDVKLIARIGFLRYFNAYFRRVIGFFDLTWHYFAPKSGLLPCQLLSKCRGSIFATIKNDFFTSLMDKTANSVKKAEDDYDYPEDLTQMMINRPKAATAKCHPGTSKSLLLSMFGQAFEELHFLPLRVLRLVYSHPMDDGQLRSFKVKFEGEGVDDYGGPYREFFSQFFAELQMIISDTEQPSDGGDVDQDKDQDKDKEKDKPPVSGINFLPFLIPSPNWKNGVGSNREKFVLNGCLLGSQRVGGSARVISTPTTSTSTSTRTAEHSTRGDWTENVHIKRQLHSEMCHFLGQMIGICLRTRVCVRLDLAISVWKQLVGEDDHDLGQHQTGSAVDVLAQEEHALLALKETDFVAYTLLKCLRGLADEFVRTSPASARRAQLDDELAAMDLTFTTYLSDGRLVELCDNGSDTPVVMATVDDYVKKVLNARANESRDVVNVIKQGIHSILPVAPLSLLTWEELEKRICGVADVDVELLKKNTEYDEDLSPNDECIQRFWRVLGSMDDDDKRAFLRFVWARSRLPVGMAQFIQKFKIQSLASSSSSNSSPATGTAGNEAATSASSSSLFADSTLPKSHTCFFALQLPRYSSDEICKRQLLYAIHNCVEMDGDFRLADTEMTGWTEINPNDQLRF